MLLHCASRCGISQNKVGFMMVYGDAHLFPMAFVHSLAAGLTLLVLPRGPAKLSSKDGHFEGKPFEKKH